jgi:mono/diheme cytochrome c family protein
VIRILTAAVLLSFAAACASEAPVSSADLARDGRDIAEAQCAACHAVGEYGESPVAEAPVFRTVLSRYRADVLEEELIQGIQVNHQMPGFQFNPQGADALIAYLQAIQQPAPAT